MGVFDGEDGYWVPSPGGATKVWSRGSVPNTKQYAMDAALTISHDEVRQARCLVLGVEYKTLIGSLFGLYGRSLVEDGDNLQTTLDEIDELVDTIRKGKFTSDNAKRAFDVYVHDRRLGIIDRL